MRLSFLTFLLLWPALAQAVSHDPQWVYRYDGPGENTDDARRVELGADGNLYVAGWHTDSSPSGDLVVISLTPEGDERWVYRYDGPAHNGWDEAAGLVSRAAKRLDELEAKISDASIRRRFVEDVPFNRRIRQLATR